MPKNRKNAQAGSRPRRRGSERRLSIRSQLRAEPDVRKYARAVIALAMAQAEREAEAEATARRNATEPTGTAPESDGPSPEERHD